MTVTEAERFAVRRPSSAPYPTPALPPYGHFIDGSFAPGSSAETAEVEDAATGTVIASVPAGTAEDVDAAVAAAMAAKEAWAATTPKERSDVLLRIASVIEANRELLERLESANTGKPDAVAQDDIASCKRA